jgi:hypothetical protein
MKTDEDSCIIPRCAKPSTITYSVNGARLPVCEAHWGDHCDKKLNLMEYCAPKCDDNNE